MVDAVPSASPLAGAVPKSSRLSLGIQRDYEGEWCLSSFSDLGEKNNLRASVWEHLEEP